MDSRQVGRHVFLFSKQNGAEESPTIVAKPVDITQDLPREFLRYLKTLFDILDEKGSGFIRLVDIETRWKRKQGSNGFSEGVIENLRKVTPKSGLLTFERLCTGMKLALKTRPAASRTQTNGRVTFGHPTKRSQSLPQLDVASKDWTSDSSEESFHYRGTKDKTQILRKLRDWKEEKQGKRRSQSFANHVGGIARTGSGSPSHENGSPIQRSNSLTKVYFIGNEGSPSHKSDKVSARTSPDQRTNKFDKEVRLKELDDEVSTLQDGLQVIEQARKWYFKRITAIQEEKLHLQNEDQYSLEQFQYELLLHRTRRKELGLDEDSFTSQRIHIKNINDCLRNITEGKSPSTEDPDDAMKSEFYDEKRKLSEEVHLLRKEVSKKDNTISQLEAEKSALIRDLFNSKTRGKNGYSKGRPENFF